MLKLAVRLNTASLLRHWGTALAAVQFAGVSDWAAKVWISLAASIALTVPRFLFDLSRILGDTDA